ncbi:RsmE family RNA methyltransferase [Fontivita pretiosa]|uniref:RsmE family RNA methyltransferase n=1 Tax=Fontivita pretiosa TaxID=2989684 RepID=UPI003D180E05
MPRRVHVSSLGNLERIELDRAQAHHVRDVLRMRAGDELELFDNAGHVAAATIEQCDASAVVARIHRIEQPPGTQTTLIVASAVPKGERADWMIEKLSELGVGRFVPLAAARSVVRPAGQNKLDRWRRIATEAARQSRRPGVMQIDPLISVDEFVQTLTPPAVYLSTEPDATPLLRLSSDIVACSSVAVLIGPEGGWSEEEISQFARLGLTGAKLTETILRVETAAIAAAAIIAAILAAKPPGNVAP